MRLSAFLIPDELLVLVLMGAVIAMIVGARKLAGTLFAFVLLSLLLPPLIVSAVQELPTWLLWIGVAYLVFLIPFVGVVVLQALVSPALGRRTAQEMGGHLAADVARATIVMPFKVLGAVVRFFVRLWSNR